MIDFFLNAGQKYCRMLIRERSAILSAFIKLQLVIKPFFLSIFEWPFYTDFTVSANTGLSSFMVTSSRQSFIFIALQKVSVN